MKAYALYRKGRKDTLAYDMHSDSPFSEGDGSAFSEISFYRPLIFENRREIKDYLLTLHPAIVQGYELRRISITAA